MVKTESIHTAINFETYKHSKINILKTLLIIKNIDVCLNKIEEIKQEKHTLRTQMQKLLNNIKKETTKFTNQLPSPKKQTAHINFESTIKIEEHDNKIDNELELIQAKLTKLAK